MCAWGTLKTIHVIRRNNPYLGDGWHEKGVDACLADYVQQMNNRGIITVGCCCGHGQAPALIQVALESEARMERYGYSHEIVAYQYRHTDGTPYTELLIEHWPVVTLED